MTVSSIGSGGGRDYSTIAAWIADCPSNLVTSTDQWIGELHNDSEFLLTSTVLISGITTSSDYYIELRAASGSEWTADSALRYDQSQGAAVRSTTVSLFDVRTNHVRFRNFQMYVDHSTSFHVIQSLLGSGAQYILFDSCLMKSRGSSGSIIRTVDWGDWDFENCAIISGNSISMNFMPSDSYVRNCTFVRLGASPAGTLFRNSFASAGSQEVKNNGFFNFATIATNPSACTGSNNATDLISIGFGSDNQVNLTTLDEITSITSGSEDLRAKSTGNLPGNGIAISGLTDDFRGETRPDPPTIGCWEPDKTVTADTGSYALTGVAADGYLSKIPVELGTYTQTGADADFNVNTVKANVGTYDLTGVSALLGIDKVVAETGSYDLTGNDNAFVVKIILAEAGSYSVTGQTALPYVSKITPETGSYTLNAPNIEFPGFGDNPLWTQANTKKPWQKIVTPRAKLTNRFRKKF